MNTMNHHSNQRRPSALARAALAIVVLIGSATPAFAQRQYQGLCAQIEILIEQELTLERIGFLATLEITNNEGDAPLTDFSAALTFARTATGDDASDAFFVQPPTIEGITAIDGTGILPAAQTAKVSWFLIPKTDTGGTTPDGVRYDIGLELGAKLYGEEVAPEVLAVIPDTITVKPEPQLEIYYFQPQDVQGDDPFTQDIVEAPVPFPLGVLIYNVGYGPANQLNINSQQPRIVENRQGLLVVPRLLGARVDDEPLDEATLNINFGRIEPMRCRKGSWDMITTLSGTFVDFRASFTHATELGGEETSLIRKVEAHFIAAEVRNDLPGRDDLLDFLADTDRDGDQIPDTLFETDCNIIPVNHLQDATVTGNTSNAEVQVTADREDWIYVRVTDPGQARFDIARIVRSDGKVLDENNYWTNFRFDPATNARLNFLHIFDFVSLGEYRYFVTYAAPAVDEDPPVTTIRFAGPVEVVGTTYWVTPDTQIFFTVEDASPVGTEYRLDSTDPADFRPALPFRIRDPGTHTLDFFSRDSAGNEEAVQTVQVVLSFEPPGIGDFACDTDVLYNPGDALSVRSTGVDFTFQGAPTASALDAALEVFAGVLSYATIAGTPSSPTSSADATLTVGGDHVDHYRYRVNGGPWLGEFAVAEPIVLTGLTGAVTVEVLGRSTYGSYLDDSEAASVSWVVDAAAPPTTITGAPPTPTRGRSAMLDVSGVDLYRWTITSGGVESFYRAEEPIATPIELSGLSDTDHVVKVIGQTGAGPWQEEADATEVRILVDRDYGLDFSTLELVRTETFDGVGSGEVTFTWDGRNDDGDILPAGVYTVRLTVTDALGRSTAQSKLVRIGDLTDRAPLSIAGDGGQKNPHAKGRWVVWQDQRNGNQDVFARDLFTAGAEDLPLSSDPRSQEMPKTDGRVAVWQSRAEDGNWNIWLRALGAGTPAVPVTETSGKDETRPAVSFPWVVYEVQDLALSGAPIQIEAYNIVTGARFLVDPTTQDQKDPCIDGDCVVWHDLRDAGAGEIYLRCLTEPDSVRLTNDLFGQFHPSIDGNWIVWTDTRHTQTEIYGYHRFRRGLVRLTDTPENESRPFLNGDWVVFQEDSAGVLLTNLRAVHLGSRAGVQLSNLNSEKVFPALASGR